MRRRIVGYLNARQVKLKDWLKVVGLIVFAIIVGYLIFSGCSWIAPVANVQGLDERGNRFVYYVQTGHEACEIKAMLLADYLKLCYPYTEVRINFYTTMVPDAYHCNITWVPAPWQNAPKQVIGVYRPFDRTEPTGKPIHVQEWEFGDTIDYDALQEALDRFWGKG